jgi:hypothetical protein
VLDAVRLRARNLGALTRASIELLEGCVCAGSLIRDLRASEMAVAFDTAILDGNGGDQPLGLLWARSVHPNAMVVSPQTSIRLRQGRSPARRTSRRCDRADAPGARRRGPTGASPVSARLALRDQRRLGPAIP